VPRHAGTVASIAVGLRTLHPAHNRWTHRWALASGRAPPICQIRIERPSKIEGIRRAMQYTTTPVIRFVLPRRTPRNSPVGSHNSRKQLSFEPCSGTKEFLPGFLDYRPLEGTRLSSSRRNSTIVALEGTRSCIRQFRDRSLDQCRTQSLQSVL